MKASVQLRTKRLLLLSFAEEDAGRLAALAGERWIADTMISVPHPYVVSQARNGIHCFSQQAATGAAFHFAVCQLADSNNFFGYLALRDINREHSAAELSFWIDRTHGRNGYATEAARAILLFAFRDLHLNRICAHAMVRNGPSLRVLAKIGMQQEGHLRQMVRKWENFEDVELWAVLRADLVGDCVVPTEPRSRRRLPHFWS